MVAVKVVVVMVVDAELSRGKRGRRRGAAGGVDSGEEASEREEEKEKLRKHKNMPPVRVVK